MDKMNNCGELELNNSNGPNRPKGKERMRNGQN